MKKQISFLISTLFGVGYFPIAPGTIASFVSLFIIYPIIYYFGFYGLTITIIASFIIAWPCIIETLKYTKHDPSFVVIDEFIGQSISFIFVVTTLYNTKNLLIYLIGFIFFRIFDVIKPFPISYADKKINNAFGVILDDIFAGIYASICLLLTKALFF